MRSKGQFLGTHFHGFFVPFLGPGLVGKQPVPMTVHRKHQLILDENLSFACSAEFETARQVLLVPMKFLEATGKGGPEDGLELLNDGSGLFIETYDYDLGEYCTGLTAWNQNTYQFR